MYVSTNVYGYVVCIDGWIQEQLLVCYLMNGTWFPSGCWVTLAFQPTFPLNWGWYLWTFVVDKLPYTALMLLPSAISCPYVVADIQNSWFSNRMLVR